jgi:hypothetical protein
MVEYGNGVGQVSGQAGGGAAQGGGPQFDVGVGVEHFVTDAVRTISAMPPAYLVVGVVVIFLGLIILRRAF